MHMQQDVQSGVQVVVHSKHTPKDLGRVLLQQHSNILTF